jgi:YesN/AraC family two-component response regulator
MPKQRPTRFHAALFLFGLILSTFPAMLVGLFSYVKASSTVQEQVIEAKQQSLLQIETHVEQVLKTADQSLTHFLNSGLVNFALSGPITVQDFPMYNQLKEELNHLQTFDTGISNIVLLSRQHQWYIDNSGFFPLQDIRNRDLFLRLFDQSIHSGWILEKAYSSGNPSEISHACPQNMNLIKKLPLNATQKTGLVVVSIPSCELNRWFSFDNDYESIYVLDENRNMISSIQSELFGDASGAIIRSIVETADSTEEFVGRFSSDIEGHAFLASYRHSKYNDWLYISIVPKHEITKSSQSIGWFTAIICFVLILLAFFTSWYGSRHIYRPVQRLFAFVNQYDQTQPGRTGRDEFEYMREQIGAVFDAKIELETKQISQMKQLTQFFITKLLQGEAGSNELAEMSLMLGLPDKWQELAVLTMQIDTLEHTKYQSKDTDLLLFSIQNIVEEELPSHMRLPPVLLSQSVVTVLINPDMRREQFEEELFRLAKSIQSTVKHYLQLSISIGVGLPFQQLQSVHSGYLESMTSLKYRFRSGQESIVFYRDLPQGQPLQAYYPKRLIEGLCDAIMVADREESERLLFEVFQELRGKRPDPNEYEISVARFLIELIHLTQARGLQGIFWSDTQSFFTQLFKLRTTEEMVNWFLKVLIEPIIKHVETTTEAQHLQISQKIIEIIQTEFDSDLTLQSIASRLHYNPNYLSNIFRKETGMLFSDYLSQHRHQIAKQWLVETGMSVREISERLHFHNAQNFIRAFRKQEGVTPGKYREQLDPAVKG